MPKQKNAFYYFMMDFREEQNKKGTPLANKTLKEIQVPAGAEWQNAPPSIRKKYEARAKSEKQKYMGSQHKYTSNGLTYAEVDRQERLLKEAEELETSDIISLVQIDKKELEALEMFVMDVNPYCKASDDYVIGESALVRFSIKRGIIDYYHETINNVRIPTGYASDVKYGSQSLGLVMPDQSGKGPNYLRILANIIDYLKNRGQPNTLPIIFTMPNKVAPVASFISQMCHKADENESLFRVYNLDKLFFHLMKQLMAGEGGGLPHPSLALTGLKKDSFMSTPGIGCKHHNESDEKSDECCLARAKRWVYTLMDSCCPAANVPMVPGLHLPPDYDLESIYAFQEQKKTRNPPTLAAAAGAQWSCNTNVRDYNDTSISYVSPRPYHTKREYKPLRQPKEDDKPKVPAPELDVRVTSPFVGCSSMSSGFSNLRLDDNGDE